MSLVLSLVLSRHPATKWIEMVSSQMVESRVSSETNHNIQLVTELGFF
jgi:hypothetical protein